jgi:pimeloyl-ACP methyl ester carboxylesterase
LSPEQAKTAIVFVHGFGGNLAGNPTGAWEDFPGTSQLTPHFSQWASCDLYFFSYSSITKSIDDSADDLERFLKNIYPAPISFLEDMCNRARIRKSEAHVEYDQLILVGHSEGGVVIRACIAELGKKLYQNSPASPILQGRVVLFAPALFGFLPTGMVGLICQFFPVQKLIDIVTTTSVAAAELRDVKTLEQVQNVSEKLWSDFPEFQAFVAHVVFGEQENVVRKQRYIQDRKYMAVRGKNHNDVCKPNSQYQEPLPFVIGEE